MICRAMSRPSLEGLNGCTGASQFCAFIAERRTAGSGIILSEEESLAWGNNGYTPLTDWTRPAFDKEFRKWWNYRYLTILCVLWIGCSLLGFNREALMEDEGDNTVEVNRNCSCCSLRSNKRSGGTSAERRKLTVAVEEIERLCAQKAAQIMEAAEESKWRQNIRDQIEKELERRVREALATPPRERLQRRQQMAQQQQNMSRADINAHLFLGLSQKKKNGFKLQRWRALQARKESIMAYFPASSPQVEFVFRDELAKSNQDEFPGVFGLDNFSEGIKNIRDDYANAIRRYGQKTKSRHFYTKEGFLKALENGDQLNGVHFLDCRGRYVDKYGVIRNSDGPFWPLESVPLFATPKFKWWSHVDAELLYIHLSRELHSVC